jgi:hypothetical protein
MVDGDGTYAQPAATYRPSNTVLTGGEVLQLQGFRACRLHPKQYGCVYTRRSYHVSVLGGTHLSAMTVPIRYERLQV